MAAFTLAQAQAKLAEWLTAESKLALGQTVAVDGQSVTFANVRPHVDFWRKEVERLELAATSESNAAPFGFRLARLS